MHEVTVECVNEGYLSYKCNVMCNEHVQNSEATEVSPLLYPTPHPPSKDQLELCHSKSSEACNKCYL